MWSLHGEKPSMQLDDPSRPLNRHVTIEDVKCNFDDTEDEKASTLNGLPREMSNLVDRSFRIHENYPLDNDKNFS
jgi:hypothetical protein